MEITADGVAAQLGQALSEGQGLDARRDGAVPSGPVTEVTLLNGDSTEGFPRIADHLPWEGHGSVKSWALLVPW